MKLGLALLCLVALALCVQQARAESIRWTQPDHEEGDTFEFRVISVEVAEGWQPLNELWSLSEIRGAVVAPLVSMTVEARTTRDGVVSEVSEHRIYVSEPSLHLGLLVGLGVMASRAVRASRPHGSQKCRSFSR